MIQSFIEPGMAAASARPYWDCERHRGEEVLFYRAALLAFVTLSQATEGLFTGNTRRVVVHRSSRLLMVAQSGVAAL